MCFVFFLEEEGRDPLTLSWREVRKTVLRDLNSYPHPGLQKAVYAVAAPELGQGQKSQGSRFVWIECSNILKLDFIFFGESIFTSFEKSKGKLLSTRKPARGCVEQLDSSLPKRGSDNDVL